MILFCINGCSYAQILPFVADKCRQLVGEDSSSQSGKFTIFNCFDMSTGTLACAVKEGVKLYFYNIRSSHVEKARTRAIEHALLDALGQGMSAKDAAKQAQTEGAKAAKLAIRQARRIIGPIVSSGWDFFEAVYYGGTITEGFLRGSGTLFGAYTGGFLGEAKLGRPGYLVGSHLGSWVGGRIGLMVYDVVNGVHLLLQIFQGVGEVHEKLESFVSEDSEVHEKIESFVSEDGKVHENLESFVSEDSNVYEPPAYTSTEVSEDFSAYETPAYTSSAVSEDSNSYESPPYESSESYENSEFR